MSSPDDKIKAAARGGSGLLGLVFSGLGIATFIAGMAVMAYDATGLFRDTGFQMSLLADLLDWFWGPPPAAPQSSTLWGLLGLLLLLPAALTLMALGWLFGKIGSGFDTLS
ncbi:MAG: hypothetical protein GYA66_05130 [Phyllobacteriaceae bacterium]|nr:hypothetical protein [Phyllobacteriaceae bacterium]